jgi:hypothetical protein
MSKFRDTLLKLFRGFFPFGYFRGAVFKEELKDFNKLSGICNILIKKEIIILIENGSLRGLEQDIITRVTKGKLAFYFFIEVIVFVFGFPVAVSKFISIDQSTINTNGVFAFAFDFPLGDESPLELFSAVVEQTLEGLAYGSFVGYVDGLESLQRFIVIDNGFVRGL